MLDSSVCLDIIKLVNHRGSALADKLKIYNLIDYAQKNKIDFLPIFALVELCYNRETLEMQFDKFFDFNYRIQFAFEFPLKRFKKSTIILSVISMPLNQVNHLPEKLLRQLLTLESIPIMQRF